MIDPKEDYDIKLVQNDAFDIVCDVLQKWGFKYTPYPDYNCITVHHIFEADADRIVRRSKEIYWSTRRIVNVNGSSMRVIMKREDDDLHDLKLRFADRKDYDEFCKILFKEYPKIWLYQSIGYESYEEITIYIIPESIKNHLYELIKEKGIRLLD